MNCDDIIQIRALTIISWGLSHRLSHSAPLSATLPRSTTSRNCTSTKCNMTLSPHLIFFQQLICWQCFVCVFLQKSPDPAPCSVHRCPIRHFFLFFPHVVHLASSRPPPRQRRYVCVLRVRVRGFLPLRETLRYAHDVCIFFRLLPLVLPSMQSWQVIYSRAIYRDPHISFLSTICHSTSEILNHRLSR